MANFVSLFTSTNIYANEDKNQINAEKYIQMSTKFDKGLILNSVKDYYKIKNDAQFARFLGVSPTTLATWRKRKMFDVDVLYAKCHDISPDFILGGKLPIERISVNQEGISLHDSSKTIRTLETQTVPFYNIYATAGIVELMTEENRGKHTPIDHIRIPNLPKCDGALPITGDSMYPLLKSGDIALYKEVHDYENIIWGEMYLIAIIHNGDEFFFAKYLQKSEKDGWIRLVSQNPHHQVKEFPLSSVKALALIKASIRINNAF